MKTALLTLMFLLQTPAWAAPQAPRTRPAVAQQSWTDLDDALPAGALLQGTYLGQGQHTGHEYRLHLLQYHSRTDAFVALLESASQDIAVLGFVSAEADGTYAWKQVTASADFEHLEPQATRSPMYRLRPRVDSRGRVGDVELTGLVPESGLEIVRFSQARKVLMYRRPIVGQYSNGRDWTLHLRRDPQSPLWHLEQDIAAGGGGNYVEKDLVKYDLPGVMAVRPAEYRGYEAQPSAQVKWAMVTVIGTRSSFWSGESFFTQVLMFKAEPAASDRTPVLVRPETGHRLQFVDPN